jgi:hypothetical protein
MATRIVFKQSMNSGPSPIRVTESVAEVAALINAAIENKHPFVALTDAETNKEVSVKAGFVSSFEEE